MGKFIDLTDQPFGKLIAKKRIENCVSTKKNQSAMWLCVCDCGNKCKVSSDNLRRGITKSCGCWQKEVARQNMTKHGKHGTRLYRIWKEMKTRCQNPKAQNFNYYGAEGKIVCEEWQEFKPFYDWSMTNGYQENLEIERIDNSLGYSPSNCRWATKTEQANNKRNNHIVEYSGECKTIAEWAKKYKMNYYTLHSRIVDSHWDIEKAITTPVRRRKHD